jgi:lipoprotein signal peptidase
MSDDASQRPVTAEGSRPPSALYDVASHLRLWPVAAIGLAVDLWTKHLAFTQLEPDRGKVIIPNIMSFHRSLNTGALFGLGKGLTIVFIIASILALGFVFFLFANSTRDRRSLHLGLALVLAGAVGNLYDRCFHLADVVTYTQNGLQRQIVGRIVRENEHAIVVGSYPEGVGQQLVLRNMNPQVAQKGVVRDFIRMEPRIRIGSRQFDIWPWVFNIADVLLVVGVGLLMLNFWRERREEKRLEAQAAATATPPTSP